MGGYQTNFNLGSQVFVPNVQESQIDNSMKVNCQEFVPSFVPKPTGLF
jgi:hypothetical protein